MKKSFFFVLISMLLFLSYFNSSFAIEYKNYQAAVIGEIKNKKVKQSGKFYITEYKLKTKKWLFKKPNIKETKYITIKILGAELPKMGLVIKPSFAPDYIPINKQAIFLLEKSKSKNKNSFTLSRGGVIVDNSNSLLTLREIENLFKEIREI